MEQLVLLLVHFIHASHGKIKIPSNEVPTDVFSVNAMQSAAAQIQGYAVQCLIATPIVG